MLTLQQIIQATPAAKLRAAQYVAPLNAAMVKYEINTPLEQAAFLAQVFHETGNLATVEEGLNYSAKRLTEVWPSRFPSLAAAQPYANNPEKLANKVYADRMGNGNEASGDGYRFRGAGCIQLTGKHNQFRYALQADVDLLAVGDYLRTPEGACDSAAWFWSTIDGNKYADGTDESFRKLTKLINGGENGIEHRRELYEAFKRVLL